jgi:hypothetical protein
LDIPTLGRQDLNLFGVALVTNVGLKTLCKKSQLLQKLNISARLCAGTSSRKSTIPRIGDKGIRFLGHVKALETVILNMVRVSDKAIAHMTARSSNFRCLSFAGCDQLTDAGLQAIAANCPKLVDLDYSGTCFVSDDGVLAIAQQCPLLEKINLKVRRCNLKVAYIRTLLSYTLSLIHSSHTHTLSHTLSLSYTLSLIHSLSHTL